MLLFLSSHGNFDTILEKYIPAKDLAAVRDTVSVLKTKVRKARPSCPRLVNVVVVDDVASG